MSIREREPPANGKYLPGGDLLHSGEAPPEMGIEVNDLPNYAETDAEGAPVSEGVGWMQRATDAYNFSTNYLDANYRKKWEDSIRAFNSQHPLDSKYTSPSYSKRSNLFRPKTRSIIRKNEAAAYAVFFSNPEAISAEAENSSDPKQEASASVTKHLLEYRLSKSIPWFHVVLGGLQDAQTTGVVIARTEWEFEQEEGGKIRKDKPSVTLIPAENFRFDPAAGWVDPVGTSPYLIELIPMFVGDVKEKMRNIDQKTGQPQWKEYGDGVIRQAMQDKSDSTRITRNLQRQDPLDPNNQPISDYEVIWVHRHIHRRDGRDWTFYTLSDVCMLTEAVPLESVVHHGKRPYVVGSCILETHRAMPSGVAELAKPLQEETNEISNQRRDNVKFVLNKKWIVKRGKNVDLPSLVRNVAGSITLADDPEGDVKEINWPDVTGSSFQEQQYLDADLADLIGDFSPAHAQLNRKGQEPAKLAQLMSQSQSPMVMYLLGTYVYTFVEPVLRQLVLLEQEYETDMVVMSIAADRAKLRQKFGIDQVTDELLRQELTIRVNIGMGAADPMMKVQRFLLGFEKFVGLAPAAQQLGMDTSEIWKEIAGHLGYRDGMRFFGGQDPEKQLLKKKLQEAGGVIQELGKRAEAKEKELQMKREIAHEGNVTKLVVEDLRQGHEDKRALAGHIVAIDQGAHGRDSQAEDRKIKASEKKTK